MKMIQIQTGVMPFTYGGLQLRESLLINRVPHFTRRAIGELLEYAKPQEAIDKIIDRNPHIRDFAVVVKLTTTDECSHPKLGCEQRTRIREIDTEVYDPIGMQLIVFESRQPKAVEYKIAVATLVSDLVSGRYVVKRCEEFAQKINSVIHRHESKYGCHFHWMSSDEFERYEELMKLTPKMPVKYIAALTHIKPWRIHYWRKQIRQANATRG
ncbi:MAG: hypothetical protein AB7E96_12175 [Deferribacterales bacterium]